MAKRKVKLIGVDEEFKKMLEAMMTEAERRRGTRPSFPQITAELSQKNFNKFMSKILFG